ncbi:hypothetical protein EDD85DRAFT_932827 [Armillaria nabsnona]|nr:hypothetical protein EDD85DRAFT_932827 [Armillaria nabsnona]
MKQTAISGSQRSRKCRQKSDSASLVVSLSPVQHKAIKSELMAASTSSSSCVSSTILPRQLSPAPFNEAQDELVSHSSLPTPTTGDPAKSAYAQLDEQTHENRLKRQERMMSNKDTKTAYGRHINNYERFWGQHQSENPTFLLIPAQPITVAKASLFLEYEISREKRKARSGEVIQDSSIGSSHILQAINALERYRKDHQHESEYQACSESLQPL